jgi:hypothetical protein
LKAYDEDEKKQKEIISKVNKTFWFSPVFTSRQAYVYMASSVMNSEKELFEKYMKKNFWNLAKDKVINVRIVLAKCLSEHIQGEGAFHFDLEINKAMYLLKKDKQKDVLDHMVGVTLAIQTDVIEKSLYEESKQSTEETKIENINGDKEEDVKVELEQQNDIDQKQIDLEGEEAKIELLVDALEEEKVRPPEQNDIAQEDSQENGQAENIEETEKSEYKQSEEINNEVPKEIENEFTKKAVEEKEELENIKDIQPENIEDTKEMHEEKTQEEELKDWVPSESTKNITAGQSETPDTAEETKAEVPEENKESKQEITPKNSIEETEIPDAPKVEKPVENHAEDNKDDTEPKEDEIKETEEKSNTEEKSKTEEEKVEINESNSKNDVEVNDK